MVAADRFATVSGNVYWQSCRLIRPVMMDD